MRLAFALSALFVHFSTATSLIPREDCNVSTDWELTPEAWVRADADTNLRKWWDPISSRSHQSFPREIGKAFGDHHPMECGLLDDSSCIIAGCKDFQQAGDPPWAYLTQISLVNLHQLFKAIDEGITKGQLDFISRVDKMALTFFPWKEPNFAAADIVIWMSFLANLLGLFAPVLVPVRLLTRTGSVIASGASEGAGGLAAAGMTQAANELEPDPTKGFKTLGELKSIASNYSERSRTVLDKWVNATFNGDRDGQNRNIIDYLAGGAFVDHSVLPGVSDVETFYRKKLYSMYLNSQWRQGKIFVNFLRTNNTNDASGPKDARYYSEEDGGVYYTYHYHEDGKLKGHLDKPWGLDELNGSTYGISGIDITKASARAWRIGGFNFTRQMGEDLLQQAVSSNKSNPWVEGAAWPGSWTLPVCDMGTHNWNTQFGEKRGKYGLLPCCCGEACKDTKAFVKAANMKGFQTLLSGCEAQLKNSDLDFKSIDYGFKKNSSAILTAAIALGVIFTLGIVIAMATCCCR
ncbi:MAG: hypothetical protein M1839_001607 [Geoglossum umbratile]|nr:MAG: hypothetical protein M1839_001607 [Geoglossum umbratile]